jgi:hypothetical protein
LDAAGNLRARADGETVAGDFFALRLGVVALARRAAVRGVADRRPYSRSISIVSSAFFALGFACGFVFFDAIVPLGIFLLSFSRHVMLAPLVQPLHRYAGSQCPGPLHVASQPRGRAPRDRAPHTTHRAMRVAVFSPSR